MVSGYVFEYEVEKGRNVAARVECQLGWLWYPSLGLVRHISGYLGGSRWHCPAVCVQFFTLSSMDCYLLCLLTIMT